MYILYLTKKKRKKKGKEREEREKTLSSLYTFFDNTKVLFLVFTFLTANIVYHDLSKN